MAARQPKPPWLRRRLPAAGQMGKISGLIQGQALHTVCQEAMCPNQMECYGRGEATFLLLGPTCTRRCTFCAVDKKTVKPLDPEEPRRMAEAVAEMGLEFCVLTMVTRDDLPDGGAAHIARAIEAIRDLNPSTGIEVLISDLAGNARAIETVLAARPEVLNHNIETVPRLYPTVRPQADYRRSLDLIAQAAEYSPRPVTKSGLMLGLGESKAEIVTTLINLRQAGCDVLTLGQYLAPSDLHHPIIRYVTPEEFDDLAEDARKMGFAGVASAPLVRSSYQAGLLYKQAKRIA